MDTRIKADVEIFQKEMGMMLGKRIEFKYPESDSVNDVLSNVTIKDHGESVDIIIDCKSGDRVVFDDVQSVHTDVSGRFTISYIRRKRDDDQRKIIVYWSDSDQKY